MTLQLRQFSLLTVTLVLLAIYGCRSFTGTPSAGPSQTQADYVVFGLSVFCVPTDSLCLEAQFNRSLGQTRKLHIRENGRPQTLTLLTNGEALAEWQLRGSGGRVTMTALRTSGDTRSPGALSTDRWRAPLLRRVPHLRLPSSAVTRRLLCR